MLIRPQKVETAVLVCVMEKNVGEDEQKLHRCFRKDFRLLMVKLFFFKTRIKGNMTRGAHNLLKYFTARKENAPIVRQRWLGPCSTL